MQGEKSKSVHPEDLSKQEKRSNIDETNDDTILLPRRWSNFSRTETGRDNWAKAKHTIALMTVGKEGKPFGLIACAAVDKSDNQWHSTNVYREKVTRLQVQ
jgi:hypothetical protein